MEQPNALLLLSLHGKAEPHLLQDILGLLTAFPVRVLEIHHQELYQNLCLNFLLEVLDPQQCQTLPAQVTALVTQRGLHATVRSPIALTELRQGRRYILTMLSREFSNQALYHLFAYLAQHDFQIIGITPLDFQNLHVFELKIQSAQAIDRQRFIAGLLDLKTQHALDLALQPDTLFRKNKRLIVFDADMTFIQCEVINELSKLAGKEQEVEAITHQAMNGELDFAQAVRARVAMLTGLTIADLRKVLQQIPYTPGVDRLVKVLKILGYKVALVSGGFNFFIKNIQERFQLDYGFANSLEIIDGRLTGKLIGEIIDAERKGSLLKEIAQKEQISLEQVIAVGDGANDLYMLSAAGLGIAFNAKRFLQERATGSLSQPNLDALLYFLGISGQELDSLEPI